MSIHKTTIEHAFVKLLAVIAFPAIFLLPLSALAQTNADNPKAAKNADQESANEQAPEAKPAEINWVKYEDGLALAQESNKHVLIDFSTTWCGYCKKMDRETFKDTRVINFINDNFVAIKVDGDSKRTIEIDGFITSERRITKELYSVRGFPTFWFLESDGSKIGNQPGFQPATGFLTLLEYVSKRKYEETAENR